jgi:hypothetical protein
MTRRKQTPTKVISTPGDTDARPGLGSLLSKIDAHVDWNSFERFFDWLDRPGQPLRHEPIQLFKALLIAEWFSLSALEFNHEIEDRRSYQQFVGLERSGAAISYSEISSFRSLLIQRSIATEVFAELDGQIRGFRQDLPGIVISGLSALAEDDHIVRFSDSSWVAEVTPGWQTLETQLKKYWQSKCVGENIPGIDDIRLSDLSEIKDHLVLIRVLPDGKYLYEMVGNDIETANQGGLVGFTINEKADDNQERHGEKGLQKDLGLLFDLALRTRETVSTGTYFFNAKGNKCSLFTALAPLEGASGRIEFLLGVASIKKIFVS